MDLLLKGTEHTSSKIDHDLRIWSSELVVANNKKKIIAQSSGNNVYFYYPKQSTGISTILVTPKFVQHKKSWYSKALKGIQTFEKLPKNWNSYGAEAPNYMAIYWAKKVLEILYNNEFSFPPTGITPSAENGIAIYFIKNNLYADIECFNNGEVLAVTSDSQNTPTVWGVNLQETEIIRTLKRIYDFISK